MSAVEQAGAGNAPAGAENAVQNNQAAAQPQGQQPQALSFNPKTLFICDLDNTINEQQLLSAFKDEQYDVVYVRINKSRYPGGLNTAFVNFKKEEDADRAYQSLNHLTLGKTEIYITKAFNKAIGAKPCYDPETTVFVKGLPTDMETTTLIKIFSQMFGEVSNLRVMRASDNTSRGYGYITFADSESAKKALKYTLDMGEEAVTTFQINEVERKFNFVFRAYVSKDKRTIEWTNIYIRDFPTDWDEKKLTEFARKTGDTTSVVTKIVPGVNLPFGCVNFAKHEDAERFVELYGKFIKNDTLLPGGTADDYNNKKAFKPYIRKFVNKIEHKQIMDSLKAKGCNIFIASFNANITKADIYEEFKKFGDINSCDYREKAIHELTPGTQPPPYPQALVLFEKPEAAKEAVTKMAEQTTINGKDAGNFLVDEYRTRGGNAATRNLPNRNYGPRSSAQRNTYNNAHDQNQNRQNQRQPSRRVANDQGMQPGSLFADLPKGGNEGAKEENIAEKLGKAVTEFVEKNHADKSGDVKAIIGILNQMLGDEELKECIAHPEHIAQYVEAVLEEM